LTKRYRRDLGFEPDAIYCRACEERGPDATAHIVLTGRTTTEESRHKDAVALRRGDDGWQIVLPANFGQSKKR
jgi:hypothetical protein